MTGSIEERVAVHAALADPTRLSIVDELVVSDRSPSELSRQFHVPGNLLAHHLDVLEDACLITRFTSSGDRRRRYVRLRHDVVAGMARRVDSPPDAVLFVCTHNSARSQLAAALWRARTGSSARSAGTHPADEVHPGAVAAARRAGVAMDAQRPRVLDAVSPSEVVVTVCDRAHEELRPDGAWWHWSVPDPADTATTAAFDHAVADLDHRIATLLEATSAP